MRCSFSEILFVDDHSTDATRDKIHALAGKGPIRLIEQDGAGPGLAGAIMAGAQAAQKEILLVMGADLSHPANRIKDFLEPLFAGTADLMVGSRYVKGGSTGDWPVWRRAVSRTGAVLAFRSLACTIPCAASLQSVVRGCWTRTANQRFQNCFQDNGARPPNVARTRNSHRLS